MLFVNSLTVNTISLVAVSGSSSKHLALLFAVILHRTV